MAQWTQCGVPGPSSDSGTWGAVGLADLLDEAPAQQIQVAQQGVDRVNGRAGRPPSLKLLAPGMRNCAMTCGDAGPGRCRSGYKKPLVLQPYHLQPSCGVFVYIRRSILGSFPSSKAIYGRHADVTPA